LLTAIIKSALGILRRGGSEAMIRPLAPVTREPGNPGTKSEEVEAKTFQNS